jgi:hypothetical protein
MRIGLVHIVSEGLLDVDFVMCHGIPLQVPEAIGSSFALVTLKLARSGQSYSQ